MKRYNKLVRDKIPDIIHRQGKKVKYRIISEFEILDHLEKKLLEEVAEFHNAKSLEELADILEVIYALAESQGFSKYRLNRARRTKARLRGGFRKRIFLMEAEE